MWYKFQNNLGTVQWLNLAYISHMSMNQNGDLFVYLINAPEAIALISPQNGETIQKIKEKLDYLARVTARNDIEISRVDQRTPKRRQE